MTSSAVFALMGAGNANASVEIANATQQTQTVSAKLVTLQGHMSKTVQSLGDNAKKLREKKDTSVVSTVGSDLASLKGLVADTKAAATGKFAPKDATRTATDSTKVTPETAKGLALVDQAQTQLGSFKAKDAAGDALGAIVGKITALVSMLVQALVSILSAVLGLVMGLPSLLGPVIAIATGALGSATGAVAGAAGAVGGVAGAATGAVGGATGAVGAVGGVAGGLPKA
jgi:hypothetical protein